jgi:hypothetical protein
LAGARRGAAVLTAAAALATVDFAEADFTGADFTDVRRVAADLAEEAGATAVSAESMKVLQCLWTKRRRCAKARIRPRKSDDCAAVTSQRCDLKRISTRKTRSSQLYMAPQAYRRLGGEIR